MENEHRLAIGAIRYAALRAFIPIIEVRRLIHDSVASLYMKPYALLVIDDGRIILYPFLEKISFDDLKERVPGLRGCVEETQNQLNASSS